MVVGYLPCDRESEACAASGSVSCGVRSHEAIEDALFHPGCDGLTIIGDAQRGCRSFVDRVRECDLDRGQGVAIGVVEEVADEAGEIAFTRRHDDACGEVAHNLMVERHPVYHLGNKLPEINRSEVAADTIAPAETLEHTYLEARRLERLVNDLLELSTIQNSIIDAHERDARTNVTTRLNDAIALAQATALRRDISPIAPLPVLPVFVMLDDRQSRSIFGNLLSNALRHAHTTVQVNAKTLNADSRPIVQITISNDGDPIAVSQLKRIFEPFVRLDEA